MPSHPSRSRRRLTSAKFALVGLLVAAPALATTPPKGFVYCHRGQGPELEVFAGEPTEDGSLRFGLTLWMPNGHHFGLWGIATRVGKGWEYQDNMDAGDPDARCRVKITHEADGTLRLVSVEGAVCGAMSHGGVGTEIGDLRFPPVTYVGPVTWQLDGSDPFFRHAGRTCPKAKTS